MSEQIPAEFAWIKPGVKCLHKNWEGIKTITREPYQHRVWGWCTQIEERGTLQLCSNLMPIPNDSSITLTLTRDQAEALRLLLSKQDGITQGFPEDERYYREIEKQIEEKLK